MYRFNNKLDLEVFLNLLIATFVFLTILLIAGLSIRPRYVIASQKKSADPNKKTNQKEDKQKAKKIRRPDHKHQAFKEQLEQRRNMVSWQIVDRGVNDTNVINAVLTVPRHAFVRNRDLRRAYDDHPLPIGFGQTISQPYIVAYMTDTLKLEPNHKVLEIGTGSGYQAAVCAEIAKEVYTIEIVEELAMSSKELLKELGYHNVFSKAGDGYFGWDKKAPFDAIIVTCAAGIVPPPLIEQLKPNGKMILPFGSPYGPQSLILITKDDKGKIRSKNLLPVRFVPMLGKVIEDR